MTVAFYAACDSIFPIGTIHIKEESAGFLLMTEEDVPVSSPRYRQVAVDIAAKIVNRQYRVGERIYARSLIASTYSVSPETARRAIAVLADLGIVEATKGSGVHIISYDNAMKFLRQSKDYKTLSGYRHSIKKMAEEVFSQCGKLKDEIESLVSHAEQFRSSNPFTPYEAAVQEGAPCAGRSLSKLKFWQNTGATIVAIGRGGACMLSPGPHMSLREGDVLYYVGDERCIDRVLHLTKGELSLSNANM